MVSGSSLIDAGCLCENVYIIRHDWQFQNFNEIAIKVDSVGEQRAIMRITDKSDVYVKRVVET